jgi:chorismate dehydratase
MNEKTEIVFAGAPYSNSAPLVDKLSEVDDRVRVMSDHPANLVQDLNAGRADVALIPVAHLFSHPELIMIKGLGVAADGPVQSVLLKCNVPVNQIQTVERDPASATSNALAELLLRSHYNRAIEMVEKASDAAVVIGDRALCSPPAPAGDIDLAEAWKEMTGLPFVFAVWAVRRDFQAIEEASVIAHKAYQAGIAALEEIASRYAKELGRSPAFWLDYLGQRIYYELGEREMKALDLFQTHLAGRVQEVG